MRQLLLAILFIVYLHSFGQVKIDSTSSVRNISLELLGNGYWYSLKYENRFPQTNLRYNLGFSFAPFLKSGIERQYIAVEPELIHLFGGSSNQLEIGVGITYQYFDYEYFLKDHLFYSTFRLGYRHESRDSRNIYKFGLIGFYYLGSLDHSDRIYPKDNFTFMPWIGISYGRKF